MATSPAIYPMPCSPTRHHVRSTKKYLFQQYYLLQAALHEVVGSSTALNASAYYHSPTLHRATPHCLPTSINVEINAASTRSTYLVLVRLNRKGQTCRCSEAEFGVGGRLDSNQGDVRVRRGRCRNRGQRDCLQPGQERNE